MMTGYRGVENCYTATPKLCLFSPKFVSRLIVAVAAIHKILMR